MDKKKLKVEAIRCATTLHCSPIAAGENKEKKPADALDTARKIYEWLKTE